MSKAGSYLEGKPEGDSSMALKIWPGRNTLSRGQAATLYMVKAGLPEP